MLISFSHHGNPFFSYAAAIPEAWILNIIIINYSAFLLAYSHDTLPKWVVFMRLWFSTNNLFIYSQKHMNDLPNATLPGMLHDNYTGNSV